MKLREYKVWVCDDIGRQEQSVMAEDSRSAARAGIEFAGMSSSLYFNGDIQERTEYLGGCRQGGVVEYTTYSGTLLSVPLDVIVRRVVTVGISNTHSRLHPYIVVEGDK